MTAADPKATYPVLLYHRIVQEASSVDRFSVSIGQFASQMRILADRGIRARSLGSLIAGEGACERAVGLTFDDGYADFPDNALPILDRYGFTATVFVVTGRLDGRANWDGARGAPLLRWKDVRTLAASGIEFGSHGRTHVRLDTVSEDRLRQEVAGSKRDLEAKIAASVRWFSHPYGISNEEVRRAIRRAGYEDAFGVLSGPPSRYNRPRIECRQADGRVRMLLKTMPWYSRIAAVVAKTHDFER